MKKIGKIFWDHPLVIFFLFVLIAYLPVLLPFFHLKNDLITQNLPTRFVISESLVTGYFPWWNPYIHYGIPQYGDMNNGFWNPVLWIIAKTFGYNILTITLEEIFYILAGGWGVFRLVKEFGSKETALLTGIAYMSCGFVVGHLQHFIWITGTAFFPYVLLYFVKANKQPILKNFIAGSFSVFLFLSATHPGMIIGGLYFFLLLLILIYRFRKTFFSTVYTPHFWKTCLLLILLSTLLSIVVIWSNVDGLAHITRGGKLTISDLLLYPTTFQSYVSLLIPLAVHKSTFFNTDISMRNVYIGLVQFIGLIIFYRYTNRKFTSAVFVCLLFFILLSAGGTFKLIVSNVLPGIGYVRLNGEFTYFVILILLLSGAAGLELIFSKFPKEPFIKKALLPFKWIFITGILISLFFIIIDPSFHIPVHLANKKLFLKSLFENFNFWHLLFISCVISLITILFLNQVINNKKKILLVTAMNFIIVTWVTLPFTGLGMKSREDFQQIISSMPNGIKAPELASIQKTKFIDSSHLDELWLLSSYSKKIGYPKEERYPVQLNTTFQFYSDTALHQFINNQSWIFLSMDTTTRTVTNFDSSHIKIMSFGPGYLKATIKNDYYRFITFLQNDYPYWEMKINGQLKPHFTGYKTFISANLPKNENEIEFIFNPKPIRVALITSSIFATLLLMILLIKKWRNYPVFKK